MSRLLRAAQEKSMSERLDEAINAAIDAEERVL